MNRNFFDRLYLNILKFIYIILYPEPDRAFKNACLNGDLKIAKNLYSLDIPDIYAIRNECFLIACQNGHLNIAQWLYSLDGKPDIHLQDEFPFREAISRNQLHIAKWLYSLDDRPDIHIFDDEAFEIACRLGHLDIAKWLYSLDDKPNIRKNDDSIFKIACLNCNNQIAQWLTEICDDYSIEICLFSIQYKILSLKDILENKEYDIIIDKLKIKKQMFTNILDKCSICLNNSNFITSCNHHFCLECFLIWKINHDKNECPNCKQYVQTSNCYLIIDSDSTTETSSLLHTNSAVENSLAYV